MSSALKQVIENIKALSPDERALIAHCLISSLDSRQDERVDEAWAALSEKRLMELTSGEVKGISWRDIKSEVKGQDGRDYIHPEIAPAPASLAGQNPEPAHLKPPRVPQTPPKPRTKLVKI